MLGWSLPRYLGKLTAMSTNAQRLGEVVLARREELDMTQLDVWQAGGPSNTTLTKIENGQVTSLARSTARKLDVGLDWRPGSARRVWEGGEAIAIERTYVVQPGRPSDSVEAEVLASNLSESTKRWILENFPSEPESQRSESETG